MVPKTRNQLIINVVIVVFIKDVLRASALEFGWLATAQGVGSIIGGVIIGIVGRFFLPQQMVALVLQRGFTLGG